MNSGGLKYFIGWHEHTTYGKLDNTHTTENPYGMYVLWVYPIAALNKDVTNYIHGTKA